MLDIGVALMSEGVSDEKNVKSCDSLGVAATKI